MHWSTRYIGLPYSPGFDCSDLARQVLAEVFRIAIDFPHAARGDVAGARVAAARRRARPVLPADAQDGDLAILDVGSNPGWTLHCGIFAAPSASLPRPQGPAILHNSLEAGQVVLTPLTRLRAGLHRLRVRKIYRLA